MSCDHHVAGDLHNISVESQGVDITIQNITANIYAVAKPLKCPINNGYFDGINEQLISADSPTTGTGHHSPCSGTAMQREVFRALTALATLTNAAGDAITAEGSDEWQTTTASLYFTTMFSVLLVEAIITSPQTFNLHLGTFWAPNG